MISDDYIKTQEQKQIELFINYMTQSFLMYFNTTLPFYIYIYMYHHYLNENLKN